MNAVALKMVQGIPVIAGHSTEIGL